MEKSGPFRICHRFSIRWKLTARRSGRLRLRHRRPTAGPAPAGRRGVPFARRPRFPATRASGAISKSCARAGRGNFRGRTRGRLPGRSARSAATPEPSPHYEPGAVWPKQDAKKLATPRSKPRSIGANAQALCSVSSVAPVESSRFEQTSDRSRESFSDLALHICCRIE